MNENNGAFYCPVCGQKTASWESDFSAQDAGYSEPGLVIFYHCGNCGALIEAYIPDKEPAAE